MENHIDLGFDYCILVNFNSNSETFFKDIFQRHFSKVFSEVFFKEIFQEKIEEKIHEPSGVQPIKAIVGAMPCVNLSGLDKHPHSKGAFSF